MCNFPSDRLGDTASVVLDILFQIGSFERVEDAGDDDAHLGKCVFGTLWMLL